MNARQTQAHMGRLALLLFAAIFALTAAGPTPADVVRSSAVYAYAHYSAEEGECTRSAFVTVGKETLRGGSEPLPTFLYMSLFRSCPEGVDYSVGAFREIPADEFRIDVDLSTATLDTSFVESDVVSGRQLELRLQLAWANTGQLQETQHFHSHLVTPGAVSNQQARFDLWEADLSGTMTDGETEFAQGAGVGALQAYRSGTVLIDRMRTQAALMTAAAIGSSNSAWTDTSYGVAHWIDTDPSGCTTERS